MKLGSRLIIFVVIVGVILLAILLSTKKADKEVVSTNNQKMVVASVTPIRKIAPSPEATLVPIKKAPELHDVLLNVPFVVQAPRHNWKDLLYQNACEEVAILMAMRWVNNLPLTNEEAYVEIKKIADYSQEKYGVHLDQSAKDVARLMRDYYDYKKVDYRENISIDDIKKELMKGNLILVPVNGQKLENPFFIQPGPAQHMLVIKGYDVAKKEFITNDSGVGKGNGYRYKERVLEGALRNYSSGYHVPIKKIEKVMIVVSKK